MSGLVSWQKTGGKATRHRGEGPLSFYPTKPAYAEEGHNTPHASSPMHQPHFDNHAMMTTGPANFEYVPTVHPLICLHKCQP